MLIYIKLRNKTCQIQRAISKKKTIIYIYGRGKKSLFLRIMLIKTVFNLPKNCPYDNSLLLSLREMTFRSTAHAPLFPCTELLPQNLQVCYVGNLK